MLVFQRILWIMVCLRTAGEQPALPIPGETLIRYAARLDRQFARINVNCSAVSVQETRRTAQFLIRWLGLKQAAEPLPSGLLSLLQQAESRARDPHK
jgi:hypothetical protein